jgi:hypothetical protein
MMCVHEKPLLVILRGVPRPDGSSFN